MVEITNKDNKIKANPVIEKMFEAGAHIGYSKSRRHPSMANFIFGSKNNTELFDLERTYVYLQNAKDFVFNLGAEGKVVLFVCGKYEGRKIVEDLAKINSIPYVSNRWIGGTLTNFSQIRSRINRMLDLTSKREKGELGKYTKKERLLIDREIKDLEEKFLGISSVVALPSAVFVVDPRKEITVVREARKEKVKVIGLMSSDNDIKDADYPILGNDSSRKSISFFVSEIVSAYMEGKKSKKA